MQETTPQVPQTEAKTNVKEDNLRYMREKYEAQIQQERAARLELERALQERNTKSDDEDDSEPYVDHKRLNKTLSSFEKKLEEKFNRTVEEKARGMLATQKKEDWLKKNSDFYEVMQHAEKIYHTDPELAETILELPDNFERQKLVYKNIKALGLDKPAQKQPSVQEKIDANRRSPYYQPSGMATAGYSSGGDFSATGQEQAYKKMQELKARLGGR